MNKIIISGNLGRDSELTFIPNSGKGVLKFSIGVARGFKKEDGTDWVNCTLFGDRAEKLSSYLIKGTKVLVEGALRINSYEKNGEKKHSTEVLVNNVEFIGGKNDSVDHKETPKEIDDLQQVDDSDIPF